MKKLSLLLCGIALLLSSCKKENPEPNPQSGQTSYTGQDTMVVKFTQKFGNGTLVAFRVSSGLDTWESILLNTNVLGVYCQDANVNSQALTLKKDSVYTIHATINKGGIMDGGIHRVVKVVPNSSNNGLRIINLEEYMYLGNYNVITCIDGVSTIEINDEYW